VDRLLISLRFFAVLVFVPPHAMLVLFLEKKRILVALVGKCPIVFPRYPESDGINFIFLHGVRCSRTVN
jgi:hypothetical protein